MTSTVPVRQRATIWGMSVAGVLHVAVHSDDNVAACGFQPCGKRGVLAEIAAQAQAAQAGIALRQARMAAQVSSVEPSSTKMIS